MPQNVGGESLKNLMVGTFLGLIDIDELKEAFTEDTLLVSIMTVQNEIGTVQSMAKIGALCHEHKAYLHTDAAQALGKIPLDVREMNIDLMSITGHKVYGPMGLGALYIGNKPKVRLTPLFSGGGQEKGIRPGTLPAPICVGFGKACELIWLLKKNYQEIYITPLLLRPKSRLPVKPF